MKDWQQSHISLKHSEKVKSLTYDDLVKQYGNYFYNANIELYAIEKSINSKKKLTIVHIEELYPIMKTDHIFIDDLYIPTFNKSKSVGIEEILSDKCKRQNLYDSIHYNMSPYFLSKKNPHHKIFYDDIDKYMDNVKLESSCNKKLIVLILLTILLIGGIYLWL